MKLKLKYEEKKDYNYAIELGICYRKQLKGDGYSIAEIMGIVLGEFRLVVKLIEEMENSSSTSSDEKVKSK